MNAKLENGIPVVEVDTPDRSQVEPVDLVKLADALRITHDQIVELSVITQADQMRDFLVLDTVFSDLLHQVRDAK